MAGPSVERGSRSLLVLRVKRRRDEPAVESVGVVGRLPQRRRLADLRLSEGPPTRHTLLARVATVDCATEDLALVADIASRKRPLEPAMPAMEKERRTLQATSVLVFSERRGVGDEGAQLVDMRLVNREGLYTRSLDRNLGRVTDPITRQLAPAILQAFGGAGLRDVWTLLSQGVDVDFASETTEGRTALMAAARGGDAALVERLLAQGADVCLSDAFGWGALEHAEAFAAAQQDPDRRPAAAGLVLKLLQALSTRAAASKAVIDEESQRDFVYDLYHLPERAAGEEEPYVESLAVIPGLTLTEEGSEIVFEYDEQWSDMGDDEDPDSNDERFAGNDYPDEEDSSYSGRSADDAGYSEDSELEEAMPKFERRGVGRVFVPFTRDDPLLPAAGRPGGVRALWGFDDEEADDEHGLRLEHMRARTGLRFGDNPREFDDRGAARFGADLSDDDDDLRILDDAMCGADLSRPSGETPAYDSELDRSDDD